ncbi:MAG: hypothetical protein ABIR76_11595 [Polaromonas sp.]
MTRTVLFANSANASIDNRALPASSFIRNVLDGARILLANASFGAAAAKPSATQPYPWLPAHIRSNMGARAQRLIRADY